MNLKKHLCFLLHFAEIILFFVVVVVVVHAERVSGPGCTTRKCGNVAKIPLPLFMINIEENLYILVVFVGIAPAIVIKWLLLMERSAKKRKAKEDNFEANGGNILLKSRKASTHLILYSDREMEEITNSYRSPYPKQLGRCRRVRFFRGTLPGAGGREVLVVEVERAPRAKTRQFVDQLIFLSRVPHSKNVARVIGCCLEKDSPWIVYALHGEGTLTRPLSDFTREEEAGAGRPFPVRAATGVARGLAHLSSQKCSKSKFVHRDICTATILVDASFNAEIFYAVGSNLIPFDDDGDDDVYRDPDLSNPRGGRRRRRRLLGGSGNPSTKSDVYSFGVVLVELLLPRGRTAALREYVDFAKAGCLRERYIGSEPDAEIMREVAAMAEMCLKGRPKKRPTMQKLEEKLSMLMPRERDFK